MGDPLCLTSLPRLGRGRWIAIGRLDINTSGLLLFTNHGELANRLMHPSYEVKREYMARIHGEVDEAMIKRLTDGVILEDGIAKFQTVKAQHARSADERGGSNRWFRVILAEGRTREVRRLWESQDVEVNRLKRISYGPIELPSFVRTLRIYRARPQAGDFPVPGCGAQATKRFSEKNVFKDIRERKEKKLRARGDTSKR